MKPSQIRILRGFTLLELLITVGILAILSTIGSGYYRNYVRNVEFDTSAKNIVFDLKETQSKAMSGEDGMKWGAHFVNGSSDYYEIFSTPTNYADAGKVIKSTVYLSANITLSSPSEGNSTDIIFDKISGASSSSSVTISLEGSTKTITVTAIGNIYTQ